MRATIAVVVVSVLLAGCTKESPVGPDTGATTPAVETKIIGPETAKPPEGKLKV